MAPHSSTLAWKIPWTEEPGGLQSRGSLRVGHDWATSLSLFTFTHWRRKAAHSSVLAWRIPGTGEPGGLPSMGSHGVGHDWSDLAAAAARRFILTWWVWTQPSVLSPLDFGVFFSCWRNGVQPSLFKRWVLGTWARPVLVMPSLQQGKNLHRVL